MHRNYNTLENSKDVFHCISAFIHGIIIHMKNAYEIKGWEKNGKEQQAAFVTRLKEEIIYVEMQGRRLLPLQGNALDGRRQKRGQTDVLRLYRRPCYA